MRVEETARIARRIINPNIPNLFGPHFRYDPYPIYASLRQHAPIYRRANAGDASATCFVTRYDDALTVLRDQENYVKDVWRMQPRAAHPASEASADVPSLQRHMLNTDGVDHHRLRALVNKAFTARMVEQMHDRLEEIAESMIDPIIERGHMDLISEFALPFPIAVIAELLGIPPRDRHRLRTWSGLLTSPSHTKARSARREAKLRALTTDYVAYMQQLLAQRRLDPRPDLISSLLRAEEEGDRLSQDELYSMILLLVVVGHETSVNLIGNGMLALLDHEAQMPQLCAEPHLLPSAIEEMLRFDCPVERAPMRYATRSHRLSGQLVQRGDAVSVVLGSANRDSAQFPNPTQFDISRFDNRHLAFGHGIHFCVGAALARLEGLIAIGLLLRRLPDLRLAVPRYQLRWGTNPIMRGLRSLPVKWSR